MDDKTPNSFFFLRHITGGGAGGVEVSLSRYPIGAESLIEMVSVVNGAEEEIESGMSGILGQFIKPRDGTREMGSLVFTICLYKYPPRSGTCHWQLG